MTLDLTLREPLGERSFTSTELPLGIGGAGSDVVVPAPAPGPLAWLGVQDDQLFLQPAHESAAVLHNGVLVAGSTWLRPGDVLDVGGGRLKLRIEGGRWLLEIVSGGAGNVTAPPLTSAAATIAGTGADEGDRIEAVAFRRPQAEGIGVAPRRALRRGRIAAWAVAAVLVAGAAFVFTSTPVEVTIEPGGARVAFEGGWPAPRFGSTHLVRPGRYSLVASSEGYETLRVPVEVTRDRSQRLSYRLVKLPGRLRIELPVPGRVRVDGQELGSAPGEFTLAAGRHTVVIDTERYLDHTAEIDIAGLGRRQTLAPRLVPGWALVSISSEPSGAELRVGGEPRGTTPQKLELMAGNHRIELRRTGFKDWVSDVQVKANEPLAIGPVRLGIPDGRLVVRSSPAGASVTVGGAYRGRTPLEIEVRPGVPQVIRLASEGYEPAEREVTVGSGEHRVVEAQLPPILGELRVRATPADAELRVDGVVRGVANQTLQLPATAHTIEIRKAGYVPHRSRVTPRPGLPQNVEVILVEGVTPAGPAAAASASAAGGGAAAGGEAAGGATASGAAPAGDAVALQPSIRTRDGQELRLVPAGSYTMGSARREAGRRANESQRQVALQRRFYVALRETTNAQFRQFRPSHRSGYTLQNTLDLDRQPVVNVTWQDAAAYCNWLSAQEGLPAAYVEQGGRLVPVSPLNTGYRLPTEAEWEWVARGGGGALRKYPWGEALPVPQAAGNYADRSAQPLVASFLADYDDGQPVSAAVGSFAPNALGFHDLGGNVAEWTLDLYTVQPPATAVATDPASSGAGAVHVIRGSSWRHSAVTELRLAYRDFGERRRDDVGFRIARYAQ